LSSTTPNAPVQKQKINLPVTYLPDAGRSGADRASVVMSVTLTRATPPYE
jgi:hypothetical protein